MYRRTDTIRVAPRKVGMDPCRPVVAAAAIAIAATLCAETARRAPCTSAAVIASHWAGAPTLPVVGDVGAVVADQPVLTSQPRRHAHGAVTPMQVTVQTVRIVARMRWGGLYGP